MVKYKYKKKSLLIASDLCHPHYQILLITYLEFSKKNAKHVWKEKISNQNVILLGLKILGSITDV